METPRAKIVELDSDSNLNVSNNDQPIWDHVYPDQEDSERALYRNTQDQSEQSQTSSEDITKNLNDFERDFLLFECLNAEFETRRLEQDVVYNHQMNCFIFDDRYGRDESTNDYSNKNEVEIYEIGQDESENDNKWYETVDDLSCSNKSSEQNATIVIYSFQNENKTINSDFSLLQVPSKDTNVSSNDSEAEVVKKTKSEYQRVPTPRPNAYSAPKFVLPTSPDLPTVSEVTEPIKHSISNQTDKYIEKEVTEYLEKPKNNWFVDNDYTILKDEVDENHIPYTHMSLAQSSKSFENNLRKPLPSQYQQCKKEVCFKKVEILHPPQELATKSLIYSEDSSHLYLASTAEKTTQTVTFLEFKDKTTATNEDSPVGYQNFDKIERYFQTSQKKVSPKCESVYSDTFDNIDNSNCMSDRTLTSTQVLVEANAKSSRVIQVSNKCPSDSIVILKNKVDCAPVYVTVPLLHLSSADSVSSPCWFRRLCNCLTCIK